MAGILGALEFRDNEIKHFYFRENSDKGIGDKNVLLIQIADMIQLYQYNVDMVVRYAGPTCDDSKKPTMADRDKILKGEIGWGQDGFYASMSSDGFESLMIYDNPLGCYYIMVVNVDQFSEDKIRVKYSDFDSNYGT